MSRPFDLDDRSAGPLRRWSPNPFALAAVALGKPFDERDPGAVLAALRDVFHVDWATLWQLDDDSLLGLLANARIGQPGERSTAHALVDVAAQLMPGRALYDRLLGQPTLEIDEAVKSILADDGSPLGRALTVFSDDEGLRRLQRLLPYVLPVAVADGPGGGTAILLDDVRKTERQQPGRQDQPIVAGEVDYLDPRQGITCDCWLIAGLIAFAWTYPVQWRRHVQQCSAPAVRPPPTFAWKLFSGEEDAPRSHEVTITPNWLIDRDSRNRIGAASSDQGEYWPALVEKAYVCDKAQLAAGEEPKLKHYKAIEFQRLHGELPQIFRIVDAESRTPSQWVKPPAPAAAGRLARPDRAIVAATTATRPPTVRLGLIKNHAYAVLGVITRAGVDEVVLRDPYGPASDALRPAADKGQVFRDDRGNDVVLGEEGVFACPFDVFDKDFEEVATFKHG